MLVNLTMLPVALTADASKPVDIDVLEKRLEKFI